MTHEELEIKVAEQEAQIRKLTEQYESLKEWSDTNDFFLKEMIDALTESVEKILENRK